MGRVAEKTLPEGSKVQFEYDPKGRLMAAIHSECTVTFQRDALGRIVKETQDDFVIEPQYDQVGHRIHTQTSLGQKMLYNYNNNGTLMRLFANPNYTFMWERNEQGQAVKCIFPGNSQLIQKYNKVGSNSHSIFNYLIFKNIVKKVFVIFVM